MYAANRFDFSLRAIPIRRLATRRSFQARWEPWRGGYSMFSLFLFDEDSRWLIRAL